MKYYRYNGSREDLMALNDIFGWLGNVICMVGAEAYDFAFYRAHFYVSDGKAYIRALASDIDGAFKLLVLSCDDRVHANIAPKRNFDLNVCMKPVFERVFTAVRSLKSLQIDGIMFDIGILDRPVKFTNVSISKGDINPKFATIHLISHSPKELDKYLIASMKPRIDKLADSWEYVE